MKDESACLLLLFVCIIFDATSFMLSLSMTINIKALKAFYYLHFRKSPKQHIIKSFLIHKCIVPLNWTNRIKTHTITKDFNLCIQ